MIDHIERKGHSVVKRYFMTRISSTHNIQALFPFKAEEIEKSNISDLRIRVIKKNDRLLRIKVPRRDYFDIFFFGNREDGVKPYGYRGFIPWDDFLPIEKISEKSSLVLPNINYKKHLPPLTDRQEVDFQKTGLNFTTKSTKATKKLII